MVRAFALRSSIFVLQYLDIDVRKTGGFRSVYTDDETGEKYDIMENELYAEVIIRRIDEERPTYAAVPYAGDRAAFRGLHT